MTRDVAPCSACGQAPLSPTHRLRARDNEVCAQRVADVLLMGRLLDELRRAVPPWRPWRPARRPAA